MTTDLISSQLELHRLQTEREVRVVAANVMLKQMLFRYQGHISAALVLGGVDKTGPHIYSIHPHGSSDKLPYATMGSGSLAAMTVFESRWKPDMTEEEGKKLVRDAIASGVFNDLGSSGSPRYRTSILSMRPTASRWRRCSWLKRSFRLAIEAELGLKLAVKER